MYVQRNFENVIRPFLARKEALALLGPRQTGKTTLLKHLANQFEKAGKNIRYLTFENNSDLRLFDDIEDFKKLYQDFDVVIIDEFQYAKDAGKKLKYLFDTTKTKYIVSGSSSLELTFQTGKYMVGRMFTFTLLPFSFREFLSYKNPDIYKLLKEKIPDPLKYSQKKSFGLEISRKLEKYFEEYLIYGGYPAVVLAQTIEEKQRIMESILSNYLLKDIRSLLQLATEDQLLLLAKLLANQTGNLINYQELSRSTGFHHNELKKYLEILEKTYIITRLKPYVSNKRVELVRNPKVYFVDTGFRNFLISDFRPFSQRADIGAIVENYVLMALERQKGVLDQFNFWRTKSGAEVDLVMQRGTELLPIEVKYSGNTSIGKSLHSFLEKFSPKEAYITTNGLVDRRKIKDSTVKFLPVYYF